MAAVHELDRQMWLALDKGDRPIAWDAWFGQPDVADYLTDEGKQVIGRAVDDLTDFFGPAWLDQAIQPCGPRGPRVPRLGSLAPTLSLTRANRAGAYVESVRWWASLQLMSQERIGGYFAIRRDARKDISFHRLWHTLAQARLGALGLFRGADVVLEPGKSGGPGDVLWTTADGSVFLEIVTFGPDENREMNEAFQDRHWRHLTALETGPIYWEGYVPGFLNRADEARWLQETTDAATRCLETSESVEIARPDGLLTVRPGDPPPGTRTYGPDLYFDFTARLTRILSKKGHQTRGAGIAWIWVEDHGGVHQLDAFADLQLAAKIPELARIARPALADQAHVAGITWSASTRPRDLPADGDAEHNDGWATQRGLPVDHLRQTVVVHRNLVLPAQSRLLAQACRTEPGWLDWALARLGITGGVDTLLAEPARARPTLLWTPPKGRSR